MKFTTEKINQGIEYLNGRRPTKPDWLPDHVTIKDGKLFSGKLEIVPWETRNDVMQTMFANPLYTGGRDRLYQHIAEKYIGISRRCVAAFPANNETPPPRAHTCQNIMMIREIASQIPLTRWKSLNGNHSVERTAAA